jgi:hypothetical protein
LASPAIGVDGRLFQASAKRYDNIAIISSRKILIRDPWGRFYIILNDEQKNQTM